jgi:hypothetical protein
MKITMEVPSPGERIPVGSVAIVNPDDDKALIVPKEVFSAFDYLIKQRKFGSVTVSFRMGSVAGVEVNTRQVLK